MITGISVLVHFMREIETKDIALYKRRNIIKTRVDSYKTENKRSSLQYFSPLFIIHCSDLYEMNETSWLKPTKDHQKLLMCCLSTQPAWCMYTERWKLVRFGCLSITSSIFEEWRYFFFLQRAQIYLALGQMILGALKLNEFSFSYFSNKFHCNVIYRLCNTGFCLLGLPWS